MSFVIHPISIIFIVEHKLWEQFAIQHKIQKTLLEENMENDSWIWLTSSPYVRMVSDKLWEHGQSALIQFLSKALILARRKLWFFRSDFLSKILSSSLSLCL